MDWNGTSQSLFKAAGASNHSSREREVYDFYATEPKATEMLCDLERFNHTILEPACGKGHISEVLKSRGYNVLSYDLRDRGYGQSGYDFLQTLERNQEVDIITNPPYAKAQEFVEKSLDVIASGYRIAMFLKITFLEGQKRKELFARHPPEVVYVSSSRLLCSLNGEFTEKGSAACYAWFIWRKGFAGEPTIRWFN